eukprot:gene2852-5610_t
MSSFFIDDGLSLAYRTLQEIPLQIAQCAEAQSCKRADFTECEISNLQNLSYFKSLEILILDKNNIEDLRNCPQIPTLHTLWCNNNNIKDLPIFIDNVLEKFPNIRYLSIMRNPACNGLMNISNPDIESIRLYRIYIIYRLPNLIMLDCEKISYEERQQAKLRGQYAIKRSLSTSSATGANVTYKDKDTVSRNESTVSFQNVSVLYPIDNNTTTSNNNNNTTTDLLSSSTSSQLLSQSSQSNIRGRMGKMKSNMRFDSKQSEGNRFIRNTHL